MYRLVQVLLVFSCTCFGATNYSIEISPRIKNELIAPKVELSNEVVRAQYESINNSAKFNPKALIKPVVNSAADMPNKSKDMVAYVGIGHMHGNYDDGKYSVKDAANYCQKQHLSFLFLTPHANEIDNPIKEIDAKIHYKGPVGYQNFIDECNKYSNKSLTIIPGTEFGDAKDGNSHFLVLGIYDANVFYQALEIYNQSGQKATLAYFDSLNQSAGSAGNYYPIIAAHPDFDYKHFNVGKKLVSETKYRFNFRQTQAITAQPNGLELLNNGNTQDDTLETNLKHVLQSCFNGMGPTFFTGGCDFHTKEAESMDVANGVGLVHQRPFADALNRRTVIWAYSNSSKDLINGLRLANSGALYRNLSTFDPKTLPYGLCREAEYNGGNTADILAHRAIKVEPYEYVRQVRLNVSHSVKYCWYKFIQNGLVQGRYSASLVRSPQSGYYESSQNGIMIIQDKLDNNYNQYILEVKTAEYTLIISPQPHGKIDWNH